MTLEKESLVKLTARLHRRQKRCIPFIIRLCFSGTVVHDGNFAKFSCCKKSTKQAINCLFKYPARHVSGVANLFAKYLAAKKIRQKRVGESLSHLKKRYGEKEMSAFPE